MLPGLVLPHWLHKAHPGCAQNTAEFTQSIYTWYKKEGLFFPQVLYLDLLCGIRVLVVSSRKVETTEPLGAGESGARQDHSKCFRRLRTHLQPRLLWHEEAFSG